MKKENVIKELSFQFALNAVGTYKIMMNQSEYVVSKQLLRSATSIGANVHESQYAESKPDFIHKMHIALKEAHETLFWLKLIKYSELVDWSMDDLIVENHSILKLLTSIIKSAKDT